MNSDNIWAHCGSCKKAIGFNSLYYACDVSTCRKAAYCSLSCFDMHTPVMRHKDAWAVEKRSPKYQEMSQSNADVMVRRVVAPGAQTEELPRDILIVASKLKDYIRIKSGMNTSGNTMERLSDMVRIHCDKAIEHARSEGRKTVMDRDFIM